MGMNVLVVGGGGREHVLAQKIAQSSKVGKVYCAPGNAGIAKVAECVSYSTDNDFYIEHLADFAEKKNIGLVVVGPEDPLAMGISDLFIKRGLRIFGTNQQAAQLEADKAFAKDLMDICKVPTAEYGSFLDPAKAIKYINDKWRMGKNGKLVVKAAGLAKGKGVLVPNDKKGALDAVRRIMVEKEFEEAGDSVVIERRLYGPEVSIIGFCDNSESIGDMRFLPAAQDYKPIGDDDKGPNTGGMGSYSPVPVLVLDEEMEKRIRDKMIGPVLWKLKNTGVEFRGILYAALMLTESGPQILEFNVRFGDPEIQPLMMRLKSDIVPYMMACTEDRLGDMPKMEFDDRAAVCVVLASGGYPGDYQKGKLITGLDDVEAEFGGDVQVFHAGTREEGGSIYTSGGRVLGVTALGDTIEEAADLAYAAAGMINFEGMQYRIDIGRDVLNRGKV